MSWFKRDFDAEKASRGEESSERTVRTEGLWQKCEGCREIIWKKDLETTMNVCGKCGYHFRMDARSRLAMLFDDGMYEEHDAKMASSDPLSFVDQRRYTERLKATQELTSLRDALIAGSGTLEKRRVHICAMEPKFIGGSMGSVVGEKIARAIDRAILQRNPLIVVSASGGARMQEGAVSLMQMAKISAGLMKLDEARVPYISVLTDPTTGGVTASYAMLGDLNIAEPGALIGFAGPRVIEQTIRQKLPEGFQRSEFLLQHGMLDDVVPRLELKPYIARALKFLAA
jgi:acetyl-CoA carboxylase carboxyl transferase subunit beta